MQDKMYYLFNENGFYITNYIVEYGGVIPDNATTVVCENGLFKPRFNKETLKWEEGADSLYVLNLVNESELEHLRSLRRMAFDKYDKYQLLLIWNTLDESQKSEYMDWRQRWLDITETKNIPDNPGWFDA